MSPRAAWRLEQFGFPDVADYGGGKMDWLAFGHAYEGTAVLAAGAVDTDVPTCRLDEHPAAVRGRMTGAGATPCVVVNEHRVVMGLVTQQELADDRAARIGDVMIFGVTTVRPSEDLDSLRDRMGRKGVDSIVVTRPDGTLVGVLRRAPP